MPIYSTIYYFLFFINKTFFTQIVELNKGKLTVGKVYAGLLILENWRTTKFGQIEPTGPQVSFYTPSKKFYIIKNKLIKVYRIVYQMFSLVEKKKIQINQPVNLL